MVKKNKQTPLLKYIGIGLILFAGIAGIIVNHKELFDVVLSTLLLVVIMVPFAYYYLKSPTASNTNQVMFLIILLIGFVPSLFLAAVNVYAMPILLSVAIISSLYDSKFALVVHFFLISLLIICLGSINLPLVVYLIVGIFITINIGYIKSRQQVLYVALGTMALMMILIVLVSFLAAGNMTSLDLLDLFIGALNGLLVIIIAVGIEPIFEGLFNIASKARLTELSNLNEPLLKRLLQEAPGTYHHSINVAGLSERAASAVGANYHLARVGALYHDIGKLTKPEYFIENQQDYNIHDELAPEASAKYIISHVEDGVKLAREHKLPKEIIQIINQHHGDSVIEYFYQKAVNHSDGFEIEVAPYRYPGPKPSTKESAIVMMADCIDAALKGISEAERNMDTIGQLIDQIINGLFAKQQLQNCPLRFSEIEKIKAAFRAEFKGKYHERNL